MGKDKLEMGWLVFLNCQHFCVHDSSWKLYSVQRLFSSPELLEFWEKDDFPMDLQSLKKYILFWLTPPSLLVRFSTNLADPPSPH